MNAILTIERLILDGLPVKANDAAVVQAAVEAELSHLLSEKGLDQISGGAVPHLSRVAIQLNPDNEPRHWGRQIAAAVFANLTPEQSAGANVPSTTNVVPGGSYARS